jgi:maltooligosyltrehalose trehalohydrolase
MATATPTRAEAPRGWSPSLGAWPDGEATRFRVWAPKARRIDVVVERPGRAPVIAPLEREPEAYFSGLVPGVRAGDRYRYAIDGRGPFPDPASRFQPEGVHGPSEVVDPGRFAWSDGGWTGITPEDLVVYELHVGTFSPGGTFDGVRSRLADLRDLGVTAIELMPVADFAGRRGWGYDGVDLFAPSHNYGRPDDLRRLVDEAHRLGLAVLLDVVYNHFGPAGNYTNQFSKWYLSSEDSPWGCCVNLDGVGSEHVNAFLIENALHWLHEYHVDGLRLDATHALHDDVPPHFLELLAMRLRASRPGRWVPLFAEDVRNLDTMIRPRWAGGWDLDGVWADDFHHEVRRLLAGDDEGYFRDYSGTTEDIATTINQGWFYTGQHSVHLDRPRGTDPVGIEPRKFVFSLQNHDQVGNRAFGERLNHQVNSPAYRAAAALLLFVPQTPLLFMGQEWAAGAPFLYFTDHSEDLGVLVTEGRRREFRHFLAFVDPEAREKIPDPQVASTFEASRLDWSERWREPHASTLRLHRELLRLRRAEPALRSHDPEDFWAEALDEDTLGLRRDGPRGEQLLLVVRLRGSGEVNLGRRPDLLATPNGPWEVVLTTEDPPFAPDPAPPQVDRSGPVPLLRFRRPTAVILRSSPGFRASGRAPATGTDTPISGQPSPPRTRSLEQAPKGGDSR